MSGQLTSEKRPGRLIVLEGIDGSGTTTQAELLATFLRSLGKTCLLTREPTPGPVGKLLRQALERRLKDEDGAVSLDHRTLALLFAADRADHVVRRILPALSLGSVVICDRYYLSSLIYQSETASDPAATLPWLRELNAQAVEPDLTLVLNVDADIAEERRRQRGGAEELFERRELQRRLALRYAQAKDILPSERILLLDGALSRESLELEIRRVLAEELPELIASNLPDLG